MEGCGSAEEVGLQYVVCDPRALVTLVSTGVFSLTLVQTSVTVGCGGLGGAVACGNCGGLGIWGALGI